MKNIWVYSLALLSTVAFIGCVKHTNDDIEYRGALVEVDAASWNANAAGVTYPILTRRVPENRAVSTTVDSTLRRFNGSTRVRINLVGPQSAKAETVGYKIFSSPIATISFPATLGTQTPSAGAATLTVTDATAGVTYTALSGIVNIPANSSFGYIDIPILNPGSTAASARFLGIQLDSSGTLRPSPNYNKVGLVIDQR